MRIGIAEAAIVVSLLFAGLAPASGSAQSDNQRGHEAGHAQPYAGQQHREITTLSQEEVAGYRAGRGMGLARPAELNGYPGPMHVLELADSLHLTAEQRQAVEAIFVRMKEAAETAGARYLELERAVDAAFRSGEVDTDVIRKLVKQADGARAEVRLAHLTAHLETAPRLSTEQRRRYAELRGHGRKPADHGHQNKH